MRIKEIQDMFLALEELYLLKTPHMYIFLRGSVNNSEEGEREFD